MDFPQSSGPRHIQSFSDLSCLRLGKAEGGCYMRFLLPAIGIAVLIVTGTALQTRFSSKQAAVAEVTTGVPVYKIDASHVKTLPEQEIPLP